jgi:hypothetical protein
MTLAPSTGGRSKNLVLTAMIWRWQPACNYHEAFMFV